MAITEIKRVRNDSDVYTAVKNMENSSTNNNPTVPPGQTKLCAIWVPWCWAPDQWKGHHINVGFIVSPTDGTPANWSYFIWQHGEYIRYSKDGYWHYPSEWVPGEAGVSGRRTLVINADRSIRLEIFWENP